MIEGFIFLENHYHMFDRRRRFEMRSRITQSLSRNRHRGPGNRQVRGQRHHYHPLKMFSNHALPPLDCIPKRARRLLDRFTAKCGNDCCAPQCAHIYTRRSHNRSTKFINYSYSTGVRVEGTVSTKPVCARASHHCMVLSGPRDGVTAPIQGKSYSCGATVRRESWTWAPPVL
jgi:hypothetical protein